MADESKTQILDPVDKFVEEACTHGICSMDADRGYTAEEALEALPHLKNVVDRVVGQHVQAFEKRRSSSQLSR